MAICDPMIVESELVDAVSLSQLHAIPKWTIAPGKILIWYEVDGKATPFYDVICPNGEDHTFALDLPGTFLYAELVSEE